MGRPKLTVGNGDSVNGVEEGITVDSCIAVGVRGVGIDVMLSCLQDISRKTRTKNDWKIFFAFMLCPPCVDVFDNVLVFSIFYNGRDKMVFKGTT